MLTLLITTVLLLFSTSSFADKCDDAAYFIKKEKYKSAKTILQPLLKKGEACAEYYMGLLYTGGNSVKETKKNRQKGVELISSAKKKGYPKAKEFLDSYH